MVSSHSYYSIVICVRLITLPSLLTVLGQKGSYSTKRGCLPVGALSVYGYMHPGVLPEGFLKIKLLPRVC